MSGPSVGMSGASPMFWQSQLPIDYLDASLTIDEWDTVSADLSEGSPAALMYFEVEQTNDGAAVETIEVEITIPHPVTGVPTAYIVVLPGIASGTRQYLFFTRALVGGDFQFSSATTAFTVGGAALTQFDGKAFYARSVGLIRVRQTTAVDVTSAQIEVNLVWDKLVSL